MQLWSLVVGREVPRSAEGRPLRSAGRIDSDDRTERGRCVAALVLLVCGAVSSSFPRSGTSSLSYVRFYCNFLSFCVAISVSPQHIRNYRLFLERCFAGVYSKADFTRLLHSGERSCVFVMLPFDDRDGFIWLDGRLQRWREARLHVLTHGLHYASFVFEGERVYRDRLFKRDAHHDRLIFSASRLGFDLPVDRGGLDEAVSETIEANSISDGYVRPFSWRGSEMMAISAQHTRTHLAIAAWEWPSYFSPEQRLSGISLATSSWRRPPPNSALTNAKTSSLYAICTLAKHQAEKDGFEDALMLDWQGNIAEATGANIFFVRGGVLHTPKPTCFLDGITRRTVMFLARERGIGVVERIIAPRELDSFHESFITGTAAEVTAVGRIDGTVFRSPGEITQIMVADYQQITRCNAFSKST